MTVVKSAVSRGLEIVCNIEKCGVKLVFPGAKGIIDAVNAAKALGWRSEKVMNVWMDFCPGCSGGKNGPVKDEG